MLVFIWDSPAVDGSIIAHGTNMCGVTPDNLGAALANSVVAIAVPTSSESGLVWRTNCSGTIIDKEWVLTAAHCFASTLNPPFNGYFYPILHEYPMYIVPWQASYYGVPTSFNNSSAVEKYQVQAIYIPYNFDYYGVQFPPESKNFGAIEDIALLHLETVLPDKYQAIKLANQPIESGAEVWMTGYGDTAHQAPDGSLNYRNIYYSGYPFNVQNSYGTVYTLGTKPQIINHKRSAWSFNAKGYSGGPVLYYNQIQHEFSLLAVINAVAFCDYPGYIAPLPIPYSSNTLVPFYYGLISAIMQGTATDAETRCIAPDGKCSADQFAYVVDSIGNRLIKYNISSTNGQLETVANQPTVNSGLAPVAITAGPEKRFMYVTNSSGNTISMYKINFRNGLLSALNPPQISSGTNPVDIKFGPGHRFVYVVNYTSNTISIYNSDIHSGLLSKITTMPTASGPASIYFNPNGTTAYISNALRNFISIYQVNPDNGMLSLITTTPTGTYPTRFIMDSSGHYAFVTNRNANSIIEYQVQNDGSLTYLQTLATESQPSKMAISQSGFEIYLYVVNSGSNSMSIYQFYPSTGEFYFFMNVQTGTNPQDIALNPKRKSLYITNYNDNTIGNYQVDNSGLASLISTTPTGLGPQAIMLFNRI